MSFLTEDTPFESTEEVRVGQTTTVVIEGSEYPLWVDLIDIGISGNNDPFRGALFYNGAWCLAEGELNAVRGNKHGVIRLIDPNSGLDLAVR